MKLSAKSRKLIAEMESHGYHFDDIESFRWSYRFYNSFGTMYFASWKELEEYLNHVCWD